MTVNKEPMIKWVNELYYSNRKQAKGFLTLITDGKSSHCCLGVACEIFKDQLESIETVHKSHDDADLNDYDSYISYDFNSSFLPSRIADLFGTETTIYMTHEDEKMNVIHANDELGLTFKEIAQGINLYYKLGLKFD